MPSVRVKEVERTHVPKYFSGDHYVNDNVYLSPERSRHYTESWKSTGGEATSMRRAKALAYHLDNMQISIRPHELIVGNYASDPLVIPISIETFDTNVVREYIKAGYVRKEEVAEWEGMMDFWDKHNVKAMLWPLLSDEDKQAALEGTMEVLPTKYTSRTQPDHDLYMEDGINKIVDTLKQKLARLATEMHECGHGQKAISIVQKQSDLKAMLIAAEALLRWTNRYSELAMKMAKDEKNPRRKEDLLTISEVCRWVPGNRPRNFWEAVQSHWFCFLGYHVIETLCHGTSLRIDQVFQPWYDNDVVINQTLPREKALGIMEELLIHVDELGRPLDLRMRQGLQGSNYLATYTLGGVKSDGSDACNELTLLILDAMDDLRLAHPDFKFRWHPKTDQKVWRRACEVVRSGLGQPSIKNDHVAISYLINHYGFTLEEARSWAVVGCISPAPTIHWGRCRRDAWGVTLVKYLENILNNGVDPLWGEAFAGPKTGETAQYKTFDELFEAFRGYVAWAMRTSARIKAVGEYCNTAICKRPLASCFFHRALDAERDVMDVPEKGMPWVNDWGIVDSVDSLISLKKLVYDDKKYTMEQLVKALQANWVGYEDMRQDFINAPKFGNDDDYADEVAKRTYAMVADEMSKVTDFNGASPMPSGLIITSMFVGAPLIGAMPNGRKRGDWLADGGINPHAGYDRNGPMAAILSASKIDSEKQKANVFNQKLTPSSVAGESGLRKLQNYIETAMTLGLDMIQFNIVDSAMLREAQNHPEQYRNLVVRVSGYNARFLDLDKFVQDAVIERTQHTF